MSAIIEKFLLLSVLLGVSTLAGYLARRLGWLREALAEPVMTGVFLAYSAVGFLSIWLLPLELSAFWLPALGAIHVILMTGAGLGMGRLLFRDRTEGGLFGIAAGMGNNGFTMGAFVAYLIYGEAGLGLSNIFCIMWTPLVVVFLFPIARGYSPQRPEGSLGRLIVRSIFDWRSVGAPLAIAGVALSLGRVPYPQALRDWRVMDVLMWISTALAYFGIGMRLHVSRVREHLRSIAWLAVARFALAGAVGVGLAWLATFAPWPLAGVDRKVFLLQTFVPTAVTMVAIANMFRLRPEQASVLFVLNTFLYVLLVLPFVLWFFR